MLISQQLVLVIILALIFEFLNGMRDSSNIVATMIASRAFRPGTALGLTAIAEFLGPFLFGVTVARTIGSDIVDAHILTLEKLQEQNGEYIYNVGTGKGSTNKEVVEMVKKISGIDFPISTQDRREGDVAETVADISKIKSELSFSPKYSDLETIIKTAWQWHTKKS